MPKRQGYRRSKGDVFEHINMPLRMSGASWVEPRGASIFFDDFQTGVLDGNVWDEVGVQATSGTRFAWSASAGGADAGHGGWIRGVTGTGDDDCEMHVQALNWTTLNLQGGVLVFETRLVAPVITTMGINAGFTDAVTEGAAGNLWNVTSSDATSAIPTDGAAWCFDTDQTTDVFRGIGTVNDVDTTFAAAPAGVAPLADDPFVLRVEIDSAQVAYFHMTSYHTDPIGGGALYAANDGVEPPVGYYGAASAGRSTIAMAPFISVVARADTDNLALECDYVFCAAARSTK